MSWLWGSSVTVTWGGQRREGLADTAINTKNSLFYWKHLSDAHQVGVITRDAETAGARSGSGNFAALFLHVDPAQKNNNRRLTSVEERSWLKSINPVINAPVQTHTHTHTPVPLSCLWRAGIGWHLWLYLQGLLTGVKTPLLTEEADRSRGLAQSPLAWLCRHGFSKWD